MLRCRIDEMEAASASARCIQQIRHLVWRKSDRMQAFKDHNDVCGSTL
jgi:hypothetical protein